MIRDKIINYLRIYAKQLEFMLSPQKYVDSYISDGENFLNSLPLSQPSDAVIEIGNKCNLNCTCCETQKSIRPHTEIKPSLFEKAVEAFSKMGYRKIWLHTNNEPLFNKNIIELCTILNKKKLFIHVSTNGMLVRDFIDNYIKADLDISLLDFRYSIDGGTKTTFESIRKGASFEVLIDGLNYIKKVYKRNNRKCKLSVNYNLSTETLIEVPIFVKTFSEYFGKDFFYQNYCFRLLDGRNSNNKDNKQNLLWTKDRLQYPVYNFHCWYPFATFAILNDGRITACCGDYNGDLIIGDIHKNTLEETWNSTRMQKLRNAHILNDLSDYPKCQNCFRPQYTLMRGVDAYIRAIALHRYNKDPKTFFHAVNKYIHNTKNKRQSTNLR